MVYGSDLNSYRQDLSLRAQFFICILYSLQFMILAYVRTLSSVPNIFVICQRLSFSYNNTVAKSRVNLQKDFHT